MEQEALANMPGIDDGRITDDICDLMDRMIQRKTGGRRVGRAYAKVVFEAIVEMMFKSAVRTGQFRFPKGFGSLYLRSLSATRKRLPNGDWIDLPADRVILRYNEGLAVRELLGKAEKYVARKKPRASALALDEGEKSPAPTV